MNATSNINLVNTIRINLIAKIEADVLALASRLQKEENFSDELSANYVAWASLNAVLASLDHAKQALEIL